MESDANAPAEPTVQHWQRREIGLALRNALKLGSSLLATWGIGLAFRFVIPRYLGVERFGILTFSDSFTAMWFIALSLGLDTYVRKEVSVRPQHASDFVGGIVLVRLVMTLFVFAGMEVFLRATHRSDEVRHLVYIYGIGQFFANGNNTSAGLLHAKGNVNELSVFSVFMKVFWGVGVLTAILLKFGLWAFGLAFLASEALKSGVLYALTVRHLQLEVRVDMRAVKKVIIAALPFYITSISTFIYAKLDVSILAVRSNNQEVGWYGSAHQLADITLLLAPLIQWVLVPLLARAAAKSQEELMALVRRSAELILTGTIPLALMMAAGSDVWIPIAFGATYGPAAPALAILAGVFMVMYMSMVCGSALIMLNKTWELTAIFVVGMFLNPMFNIALIPPFLRHFGAGGGGMACATATVATEVCVLVPMLFMIGRRMVDARLMRMLAKSFGSAIVIFAVDRLFKPWIGVYRLPIDLVGYVSLILVTRAVNIPETIAWTREILSSRKAGAQPAPANPG